MFRTRRDIAVFLSVDFELRETGSRDPIGMVNFLRVRDLFCSVDGSTDEE